MNDPLHAYVRALESLRADNVENLLERVDERVHFSDPFNDCRGRAAYGNVLADMFEKLKDVEFVVEHHTWCADAAARTALLKWTLRARLWRRPWIIGGCSELSFNETGLVTAHHDYWDAAAGVYARIPVLGALIKAVRRRVSAE
jgi:hypothetical protein